MFSVMSVCLFTRSSHVTINHNALSLTVQGLPTPLPDLTLIRSPSGLHETSTGRTSPALIRPPSGLHETFNRQDIPSSDAGSSRHRISLSRDTVLVTSGGLSSNLFNQGPPQTNADIWRLLKHMQLAEVGSMFRTRILSCIIIVYKKSLVRMLCPKHD